MTSRLDAIKARAEAASHANHTTTMNYNAVYSVVWRSHQDIPALVAAVEAVLELHKEVGSWRSGVYQCGQCAELCHSTSGLGCEDPIDAVWPCPTVVAIQAALGEGEQ